MNRAPIVSDAVHYCPVEKLYRPLAATITGLREDGTADLCVFLNYEDSAGHAATRHLRGISFSEKPLMGCWSWPPSRT